MADTGVGSVPGESTVPAAGHEGAGHLAALSPPSIVYSLRITAVTSFLIMTQRRTKAMTGDIPQLEAFYRKVLTHNLILGWWGLPFGLIWTPMVMSRNKAALKKLHRLQAEGPDAGWYRDPTGRHSKRWWDGTGWTEQVSDTSVQNDPVS